MRSKLFAAETRNPHIPIPLKMQLNVLHFQSGRLPVLGHLTAGRHHVLDEVVGDLKQDVFHVVVEHF